jgi:methylthioribulose-1-phosphate dehydratase
MFKDKKDIICYLLREFYKQGWCTGSGGGISIREAENRLLIAPSGVHKEFVQPEEIFEIDQQGPVLVPPANPKLRISECTPLFLQAYNLRDAGAVLHSHSVSALLVTRLFKSEFQVTDLEMIKGILDHKNTDWCRVPIIENTEFEPELTDRLRNAIIEYPRSHAVLVRNHGVYVWGPTWEKAKIHAECYEYLFKAVIKLQRLNIALPVGPSSDPVIRAWYIDETKVGTEDIRSEMQHREVQWVNSTELSKVGVLSWKLSGEEKNEELEEICRSRQYKNRDQIKCGLACSKNYQELLNTFSKEHLHADEEIRYVLDGSGYFDIRSLEDKWIRVHVTKGDLLILPEGIYHRFSTDHSNYIHAMRLFKEEPKRTPINRPSDEHPSRIKYLKELGILA